MAQFLLLGSFGEYGSSQLNSDWSLITSHDQYRMMCMHVSINIVVQFFSLKMTIGLSKEIIYINLQSIF